MNTVNLLILVCTVYVALLFLVAFVAERSAMRGRGRWLADQPCELTPTSDRSAERPCIRIYNLIIL